VHIYVYIFKYTYVCICISFSPFLYIYIIIYTSRRKSIWMYLYLDIYIYDSHTHTHTHTCMRTMKLLNDSHKLTGSKHWWNSHSQMVWKESSRSMNSNSWWNAHTYTQGLLEEFINYLKAKKISPLDEVAAEFKLKSQEVWGGVATISGLLKIIGLFCRI